MPRSRRSSSPAPQRRAAPAAPAKTQPQNSSVPAHQPQQPGMLASIASTAAGVGIGSVVGHGMSNMLFGSSSSAAPVQQEPQQQQYQNNNPYSGPCENDQKAFMRCLDSNPHDMNACNFYLDMLKQCNAQSQQRF